MSRHILISAMNSADMSGLERKRCNWEKSRNCQVQLQKRSGLVKIIVTIQYLPSYVQKSIQISFADEILSSSICFLTVSAASAQNY